MSKPFPYFKRQRIIQLLIEELAEEGRKRPGKIEALKEYSSNQDRYVLLNKLVEDGILEREEISPRNVRYAIDENVRNLVRGLKKAHQVYLDAHDAMGTSKLDQKGAVSYRVSTFLFQLEDLFQVVMAVAYYHIYKTETRPIVLALVQKETEDMVRLMETLAKNNQEATGQAIRMVSELLIKTAENPELIEKLQ